MSLLLSMRPLLRRAPVLNQSLHACDNDAVQLGKFKFTVAMVILNARQAMNIIS